MKHKNKKETNRQCISCRSQLPQEELIRIAKISHALTKDQKIIINPNKYQFGRSVYVCRNSNCIQTAIKGKKITKMLKVSLTLLNQDLINDLENLLNKGGKSLNKEVA